MWQAEVRIDLDAIRDNVATLRASTAAEVMAVVKGDGYGHGMLPSARAALAGGATWLGVCTLDEGLELRRSGITAPVLAWLVAPGLPLHDGVAADVDLSAASLDQLAELVTAARRAGRPARAAPASSTPASPAGGATAGRLAGAAARPPRMAQAVRRGSMSWASGAISCTPTAPGHETIDRQLGTFADGAGRGGAVWHQPAATGTSRTPPATLTRPDAHYDLVGFGIAVTGLVARSRREYPTGLRPAMTARARVAADQAGAGRSGCLLLATPTTHRGRRRWR
jgi:alanine racemase